MVDIFLSYAERDRQTAETIANLLEEAGWSVWWDRKIRAGTGWRSAIAEALEAMTCLVVLWSRNSVASQWVNEEAELARHTRRLIPVLIDGTAPPIGFREVHCADLTHWDGSPDAPAFRQLLHDIEVLAGAPRKVDPPASAPTTETSPQDRRPARGRRRTMMPLLAALGLAAAVGGLIIARQVAWTPNEGIVPTAVDPAVPPAGPPAVSPAVPEAITPAVAPPELQPSTSPEPEKSPEPAATQARPAPATPQPAKKTPPAASDGETRAVRRDASPSGPNPRCGALLGRLQLGESLSEADRLFLARECRR